MHREEATTPGSDTFTITRLSGLTVTCCTHVAMLLQASVAFQVMLVLPCGYGAVSGWLSLRVPVTTGAGAQLSVAAGATAFTVVAEAVHPPASAFTMIVGSGQVGTNTGGVVSLMVMICMQRAKLPLASVAL